MTCPGPLRPRVVERGQTRLDGLGILGQTRLDGLAILEALLAALRHGPGVERLHQEEYPTIIY